MLSWFMMAILGGIAALVLTEIVSEVRGSSRRLQDRYHE
jgi:hypothetical protein